MFLREETTCWLLPATNNSCVLNPNGCRGMLCPPPTPTSLPVTNRCVCMCKDSCAGVCLKFCVMQHIVCVCVCVCVTVTSQIPAFVSRCRSTCMLSLQLCLNFHAPSFGLCSFRAEVQLPVSTRGLGLRLCCSRPD